MMFHSNFLPVSLTALLLQHCITPAFAKFEVPDWEQLIKFPSTSTSDAFNLKWDATNTNTPAKLFLWKGPPENFTLITPISDPRGNTDLKNTGSLTWVIKDGEVPSSGKDYTVELRLNPGVQGKESSQWSNYFELFNEEKPDPQKNPVPSVYNIGTAAPVPSATASGLPTTPMPLPPVTESRSSIDRSGSSSSSTAGSTSAGAHTGITISAGALAGIIIGTMVATAAISSLATYFLLRHKSRKLRGNDIFRDAQPMPPGAPSSRGATTLATQTNDCGSDGPDALAPSQGISKKSTFVESPTTTEIDSVPSRRVTELPAGTELNQPLHDCCDPFGPRNV